MQEKFIRTEYVLTLAVQKRDEQWWFEQLTSDTVVNKQSVRFNVQAANGVCECVAEKAEFS